MTVLRREEQADKRKVVKASLTPTLRAEEGALLWSVSIAQGNGNGNGIASAAAVPAVCDAIFLSNAFDQHCFP